MLATSGPTTSCSGSLAATLPSGFDLHAGTSILDDTYKLPKAPLSLMSASGHKRLPSYKCQL